MSELEILFEKLGYKVSWDFSKKLGESWIEVLDPKSGRVVLQVSRGVLEEDFLREFFLETEDPLPFFIGYEESEDGEILKNKLKEYSILRRRSTKLS